jgi:hypothetical protein
MPMQIRTFAALLGAALLAPAPAFAQAPAILPAGPVVDGSVGGPLALTIRRTAGPIRIDGELDDAGWSEAARAVGWVEFNPGDRVPPPVRTEAWITYDEENLYVAFIADTDPREIRAALADRDRIWSDDAVGVVLDTFGDGATGLLIVVNALGVQGDLLLTAQGDDPSFDLIYRSGARITDTGYQVEMAIPFRSLRFPNREVQTWRVNFYRQHPRATRHQIAWAPLDQNNPCLLCQSAPLHGIEGIRPGGSLELLPAVVASQAGRRSDPADPASPFRTEPGDFQASLGAKYAFTGGWTAEAAVNPDFSQVESDAAQVDVNTTFALFYPERRPFFQEGADLFNTDLNVVYTRSINAPIAAAKLTGRAGANTRVAYLGARDRHTPFVVPFEERSMILAAGPSVSNILRVRHGFRDDSHLGLLLTDRRLEGGGSGTTGGLDGRLRFAQNYSIRGQFMGSYTVEPDDATLTPNATHEFGGGRTAAFDGERYGGHALQVAFQRSARHLNFNAVYGEANPTYRADNGFQTRNDYRRMTGQVSYTIHPAVWWADRLTPGILMGRIVNFAGVEKDVWVTPQLWANLTRQTYVSVNAIVSRETFRDVEFSGIRRVSMNLNTEPDPRLSFGFYVNQGRFIARFLEDPVLGRGRNTSLWASLKPVPQLAIEPSVEWARLDHPDGENLYDGSIARLRTTYQFTRELFVRVVTQYNGFADRYDVEPLVMYRLNPFSIFYLGATSGFQAFDEPYGFTRIADRQLFVKFQYLFRL